MSKNDGRLNTDDLKNALDVVVNLGETPQERDGDGVAKLFKLPFYLKKVFIDDWFAVDQEESYQKFMQSEAYKSARKIIIKHFDMDGDGKITPKDFQIMYDQKFQKCLNDNQDVMNKYLPFAGQIAFGFFCGLGIGALCRNSYKGKYWIAGFGFAGYSAVQYAAQKNFVNQKVIQDAFQAKIKELADVNNDGKIDRNDLNALVENRMRYIATKLGPGGIAPGVTGYASVILGFMRGVRVI